MKKVILTILALGLCAGAFAQTTYSQRNANALRSGYYDQRGGMSVGAGLVYGSEIESVGINIKYNYMLTNGLRLAPNATFFFKNDGLSSWDINADLHYLIPLGANWKIYPLAGLTVSTWKWDGHDNVDGDSETKFGLNLGAGVEYDINRSWFLTLDVKYRIISDYDQAVIGLGFGYRF